MQPTSRTKYFISFADFVHNAFGASVRVVSLSRADTLFLVRETKSDLLASNLVPETLTRLLVVVAD